MDKTTAYIVKLPAYDALIAPGDTGRAMLSQTRVKATLEVSPNATLVNRFLLGFGQSEDKEHAGYDEFVPREQSVQDRLESREDFSIGRIDNGLITGLDFRYTGLSSYQDYQFEPYG